ncbi:hypothetical protein BDZ97DRAFT_1758669 [Flammula alnicola]|nr:hypothetical protein BDZ97DRAFT_1758669 [Flammula alnicola]
MPFVNEKKEGILPSSSAPEAPPTPTRLERMKAKYRVHPKFFIALWVYFVVRLVYESKDYLYLFNTSAIDWLARAVRVPTESFDNMDPVGTDPRWDAFGPFHDYLLGTFPLFIQLSVDKSQHLGLYYEWKSSDASLKPLLLAAHQGKRIWGRGSSDDKSGLIDIR